MQLSQRHFVGAGDDYLPKCGKVVFRKAPESILAVRIRQINDLWVLRVLKDRSTDAIDELTIWAGFTLGAGETEQMQVQIVIVCRTSEVRHGAKRRCLHRLVCAQHGRVVNGVKVPCRRTTVR